MERSIIGKRSWQNRRCRICVTLVVLGTFIGCILLGYTAYAEQSSNSSLLQQVVFVFRHGDRTPTETYPNDPYINYKWENGWGSLTKKGMLQLYRMGQWIRKEYSWIIGNTYNSSSVLVRSSYADRCLMSAETLLAGLYPPAPEEMFVPGLAWRPVPVHSVPKKLDKVIVIGAECPRLEMALKEAYANETIKEAGKMNDYYKKLGEYAGKHMTTITDVEFLYNTLEIEKQHGLKLPEWTKEFYNEEMREIAARSLAIFTSNTIQKRLRGGPLLKEILKGMQEKDAKRAYLYSAHDITLVNLLRTMGFTDELFKPDYGATLIFELHSINDGQDQAVKLLYVNNTETEAAHRMNIPKCAEPCLLKDLLEIWKDVIPENWDAECQLGQ